MRQDETRVRPNAVLKSRAEKDTEFGEKLYGWCCYGLGFGRWKLKEDLQLDASLSTLSKFARWWEKRVEFADGDKKAGEYEKEIRSRFPMASEQEIVSVCQKYFEETVMKEGNRERVKMFTLLWLEAASSTRKGEHEARKLDLEERKVAVLEKKLNKDDKNGIKKKRRGGTLSEAALMEMAEQAKLL